MVVMQKCGLPARRIETLGKSKARIIFDDLDIIKICDNRNFKKGLVSFESAIGVGFYIKVGDFRYHIIKIVSSYYLMQETSSSGDVVYVLVSKGDFIKKDFSKYRASTLDALINSIKGVSSLKNIVSGLEKVDEFEVTPNMLSTAKVISRYGSECDIDIFDNDGKYIHTCFHVPTVDVDKGIDSPKKYSDVPLHTVENRRIILLDDSNIVYLGGRRCRFKKRHYPSGYKIKYSVTVLDNDGNELITRHNIDSYNLRHNMITLSYGAGSPVYVGQVIKQLNGCEVVVESTKKTFCTIINKDTGVKDYVDGYALSLGGYGSKIKVENKDSSLSSFMKTWDGKKVLYKGLEAEVVGVHWDRTFDIVLPSGERIESIDSDNFIRRREFMPNKNIGRVYTQNNGMLPIVVKTYSGKNKGRTCRVLIDGVEVDVETYVLEKGVYTSDYKLDMKDLLEDYIMYYTGKEVFFNRYNMMCKVISVNYDRTLNLSFDNGDVVDNVLLDDFKCENVSLPSLDGTGFDRINNLGMKYRREGDLFVLEDGRFYSTPYPKGVTNMGVSGFKDIRARFSPKKQTYIYTGVCKSCGDSVNGTYDYIMSHRCSVTVSNTSISSNDCGGIQTLYSIGDILYDNTGKIWTVVSSNKAISWYGEESDINNIKQGSKLCGTIIPNIVGQGVVIERYNSCSSIEVVSDLGIKATVSEYTLVKGNVLISDVEVTDDEVAIIGDIIVDTALSYDTHVNKYIYEGRCRYCREHMYGTAGYIVMHKCNSKSQEVKNYKRLYKIGEELIVNDILCIIVGERNNGTIIKANDRLLFIKEKGTNQIKSKLYSRFAELICGEIIETSIGKCQVVSYSYNDDMYSVLVGDNYFDNILGKDLYGGSWYVNIRNGLSKANYLGMIGTIENKKSDNDFDVRFEDGSVMGRCNKDTFIAGQAVPDYIYKSKIGGIKIDSVVFNGSEYLYNTDTKMGLTRNEVYDLC